MADVCPPCPPQRNPRVTFLHNIAGVGPYDFYVDNVLVFSNVAYEQQTTYRLTTPGTHEFSARPVGSVTGLNNSVDTKAGNDYTFILEGALAQAPTTWKLASYTDDNNGTSDGNARFRYIQAAAGFPLVDLYVNGVLLESKVAYPSADPVRYYEATPGDLTLTVRLTGTQTIVSSHTAVALSQDFVTTFTQSGLYESGGTPVPPPILVFSTPAL